MNDNLLQILRETDTPTICNAIEEAQGKRGFSNFTRKSMHISELDDKSIVGYALTAKIIASIPPKDSPEIVKKRRMDYYKYVSLGENPSVIVIEDEDGDNPCGAFWGEVNATIHKALGLKGVITNGTMRDLDVLPKGFPILSGAIGPSHSFVHVTDFDCVVNILGMNVNTGDLIHADRHGACVIPNDILNTLEYSISKLMSDENIVLEPARKKGFNYEILEKAWSEIEKSRSKKK